MLFSPLALEQLPRIGWQILWAFLIDLAISTFLYTKVRIGFGVLPIVFSFNLFIWFTPENFHLQLLFLTLAVASKHALVWDRDGIRRHIFNPSAVGMFLAVMFIMASGKIESLQRISSAYEASRPTIFWLIFLAGLVSQSVGRTIPVAAGALFGLYALNLLSLAVFSAPVMVKWITPSIFVGVTLLITDPATTPKHPLSQFIFGLLYAGTIVFADQVLCITDQWKYFSKIMGVCLLNLTVPYFDSLFGNVRIGTRAVIAQLLAYSAFFAFLRLDIHAPKTTKSFIMESFGVRCTDSGPRGD